MIRWFRKQKHENVERFPLPHFKRFDNGQEILLREGEIPVPNETDIEEPDPSQLTPTRIDPVLRVENLAKTFFIHHLNREIHAFDNVSFDLAPGKLVRIGGPNGAGKSSLLRCLYRTCRPSAGAVWMRLDEMRIDLASLPDHALAQIRRHQLSFVTQFLQFRPRLTAQECVIESMDPTQLTEAEKLESAQGMLWQLGLKQELWQAYPNTFSGGEQQKVNLARGLVHTGQVLLLDEPTASLDAAARRGLADRLRELKNQGVAMICVLHHPEDMAGLIDETIHLKPTDSRNAVV